MPSVTIDAGALAVPPHNVSAEDARRYVKTVLGWSRLIDCPWVEVNMSRDSCVALFCDNLFPFYPQLKDLIAYTGIEDFDANTINTVVIRLLDKSVPSFEEYFGVSEVLAEDLHISPEILRQSLGDELRSDLSRCLLLTAILRKYCGEFICSHALVVRHAPVRLSLCMLLFTRWNTNATILTNFLPLLRYLKGMSPFVMTSMV